MPGCGDPTWKAASRPGADTYARPLHAGPVRPRRRRRVAGDRLLTAAPQRVRLVDEHDRAAVAHRELPELTVEGAHLEDADPHEHVDERAGVDVHERLGRLAGDGLGHEGLAGAGRAPEQDAARHVAAPRLDRLGVVEEDQRLLELAESRVLPLHVVEPGLDLVGHDRVDAAARQEPEQSDELEHHEEEAEGQLHDERQRHDEPGRRLDDAEPDRVRVEDAPEQRAEDQQEQQELECSSRAVARVVVHLAEPAAGATEHGLLPEVVVALRAFFDEVVHLAQELDAHQRQQPPVVVRRDANRIDQGAIEGFDARAPDDRQPGQPEDAQEDQQLDAVPEDGGCARQSLRGAGPRRPIDQDVRSFAVGAHAITAHELITDSMSPRLRPKHSALQSTAST